MWEDLVKKYVCYLVVINKVLKNINGFFFEGDVVISVFYDKLLDCFCFLLFGKIFILVGIFVIEFKEENFKLGFIFF